MNMQPVNKTPGKSARNILNAPALNVYSDAINSDIPLYKMNENKNISIIKSFLLTIIILLIYSRAVPSMKIGSAVTNGP